MGSLPEAGKALLFTHPLVHEGQALHEGTIKYTLRTEVMYVREKGLMIGSQLHSRIQTLTSDGTDSEEDVDVCASMNKESLAQEWCMTHRTFTYESLDMVEKSILGYTVRTQLC